MRTCALCSNSRKLCDSHIIPEFLYTPTYDDGRAIEVSAHGRRSKFVQKGRTEKLLCSACEEDLSREYEDYFARLWYRDNILPESVSRAPVYLSGLDYRRFKLFHLSILWRASVARSEIFEDTHLGPFEAEIREMLIEGNAGPEKQYQIFGTAMTVPGKKKVNHGMVMPPLRFVAYTVNVYVSIYGGCAWETVVSRHAVTGDLEARSLKEDGTIRLGVGDMGAFAPLRKHYKIFLDTAGRKGWKLPWAGA